MSIYAFTRPDQMVDHKFTDDVAICEADSVEEAKIKFSGLYADVEDDEISVINFDLNSTGVVVLTDY